MAKTGYVNGSDLLLSISGVALGHCTTHTITYNSETRDRAVKPVASASISAGLWKAKGITGLSISISGEGLSNYDETEGSLSTLLSLWATGGSVTVTAYERESSESPYLEGSFVITSMEQVAGAQEDATYKISLENDGEPTTFSPENITVNSAS